MLLLQRMRFHLCLQRNNLKANGMIKILMTLISRNHGRMKINLLRLRYDGLHFSDVGFWHDAETKRIEGQGSMESDLD
ncbi:hypothetical protein Gotur_030111 [Gossypium turneri]